MINLIFFAKPLTKQLSVQLYLRATNFGQKVIFHTSLAANVPEKYSSKQFVDKVHF